MNNTLGLKARPNESFSAAFQPGQARNKVGVENVITKAKKMPTIILILVAIYAVMIEMSIVITSVIFTAFNVPARYKMIFESAVKRRLGRILLSLFSLPFTKSAFNKDIA